MAPSLGSRLQALASYALDDNQLNKLSKVITKAIRSGESLKPLSPFRLGLLSNSTVDFVVPSLIATAARHGIALECIKADYDQVIQEALSSRLHHQSGSKPDAVLIAIDYRALPLKCQLGSASQADDAVTAAPEFISRPSATASPLTHKPFASSRRSRRRQKICSAVSTEWFPARCAICWSAFNRGLAESTFGTSNILLDVAGLAENGWAGRLAFPRSVEPG